MGTNEKKIKDVTSKNFRKKNKTTKLKGQYIKYKENNYLYANYKEPQFLKFTLNIGTHQFHNIFALGYQLVCQT